MNLIFAILGIIGGIIAGTGDMLLDLKGRGNQKLGTSKNIDSNWLKMSEWRFRASVICGMIGCPLGGLGYISLANQIEPANYTLAFVFKLATFVGIMGGFFIHTFLSVQPIIYKRIMKTKQFELADDVLEGLYDYCYFKWLSGCAEVDGADESNCNHYNWLDFAGSKQGCVL